MKINRVNLFIKQTRNAIVGLVSMSITLVVVNTALSIQGYEKKPHSWIFQNEEFIQESDYRSFFTVDKDEIFKPREQTVIMQSYWETDENGFRLNPAHNEDEVDDLALVLGDSFAYAHGVKHDEAWTAVLERKLRENGMQTTIYNAGVPASGTDQQYVRFLKLIEKLEPEKVIWTISMNDMVDSNLSCLFKKTSAGYQRFPGFMNIAYINAFLVKHLPKRFVASNIGNLLTTLTIRGRDVYTIGCTEDVKDEQLIGIYFKKLEYLLRGAKEKTREKDIELLIVLAPTQLYFDREYENVAYEIEFLDYFRDSFKSAGVKYLDLNKLIAQQQDPELYAWRQEDERLAGSPPSGDILGATTPHEKAEAGVNYDLFINETAHGFKYGDWHLNTKGNAIVADIIIEYLL